MDRKEWETSLKKKLPAKRKVMLMQVENSEKKKKKAAAYSFFLSSLVSTLCQNPLILTITRTEWII